VASDRDRESVGHDRQFRGHVIGTSGQHDLGRRVIPGSIEPRAKGPHNAQRGVWRKRTTDGLAIAKRLASAFRAYGSNMVQSSVVFSMLLSAVALGCSPMVVRPGLANAPSAQRFGRSGAQSQDAIANGDESCERAPGRGSPLRNRLPPCPRTETRRSIVLLGAYDAPQIAPAVACHWGWMPQSWRPAAKDATLTECSGDGCAPIAPCPWLP
jgi:hypothetical protein